MEVWLKIDTDNAAFSDGREIEVARILRETASKIECQNHFSDGFDMPLRDINGNETGFIGLYAKPQILVQRVHGK